jgi:DHA1 family inner membrane transport protein
MFAKAYETRCAIVEVHCSNAVDRGRSGFTRFAFALGSFCIGTSASASMGTMKPFPADLGVAIPAATNAIWPMSSASFWERRWLLLRPLVSTELSG